MTPNAPLVPAAAGEALSLGAHALPPVPSLRPSWGPQRSLASPPAASPPGRLQAGRQAGRQAGSHSNLPLPPGRRYAKQHLASRSRLALPAFQTPPHSLSANSRPPAARAAHLLAPPPPGGARRDQPPFRFATKTLCRPALDPLLRQRPAALHSFYGPEPPPPKRPPCRHGSLFEGCSVSLPPVRSPPTICFFVGSPFVSPPRSLLRAARTHARAAAVQEGAFCSLFQASPSVRPSVRL